MQRPAPRRGSLERDLLHSGRLYPDISKERMLVDAMIVRIVLDPTLLDTTVSPRDLAIVL